MALDPLCCSCWLQFPGAFKADFSVEARPKVRLPEELGGSLTVGSKETDLAGLVSFAALAKLGCSNKPSA